MGPSVPHPLMHLSVNKIFNRSSIKVGYSCMKNMKSIMKSHNSAILKKHTLKKPAKTCNCRNKVTCPLRGKCLANGVVYKATVSSHGTESKSYIGLSGGDFKSRYNNHNKSFRHQKHEKETALSKYIWELKRKKRKLLDSLGNPKTLKY